MTKATGDNTRRKRSPQAGQLIGVRLQPDQLAALDAWMAQQPEPMTRPEAVRRILGSSLA
jgi:hypothetical protein